LFTLLSGRHVHEADGADDVMMLAGAWPARPLRDVAPRVPEAVAAVVDKALAFRPDARF
jgi:serine/threonine-protein kinase